MPRLPKGNQTNLPEKEAVIIGLISIFKEQMVKRRCQMAWFAAKTQKCNPKHHDTRISNTDGCQLSFGLPTTKKDDC